MSLTRTAPRRFFVSTEFAHHGDRIHADLQDGSSLLLVLKYDHVHDRWYITFDERGLPLSLMDAAGRVAVKVLRLRDDYVYGRTTLKSSVIRELALDICTDSRILNAVKTEGGAFIEADTRLSALVGSDCETDVPAQFQERWYASARLASLIGRPVRTVQP